MTALLASAGVLAAVRVASADIGAQVTYLCATPKATYQVVLGIKAKVPAAGKTNTPVRIGDVGVTLKVPGSLRSELAAAGVPDSTGSAPAPSLNGVASILVNVNQGQTSVNAGWPAFSLTSDSDQADQVVLRGAGAVPALLTDQAGQVSWKAGQMVLRLSVGQKASTSTLTCTPKGGAALGNLALKGGTSPSALPKNSPLASQPADDDSKADCIIPPDSTQGGGINRDPRLAEPPIPPGMSLSILRPERPGTPECGKAAGFGNLGKLKAAIPVGAQIRFRVSAQNQIDVLHNYLRSRNYGSTATTPSTGTALGFGFMPTTATVLTKQVAPPGASSDMANLFADVAPDITSPTSFESRAFARSFVDLRVGGISVNGTRLGLGENCHTGALPLNITADLGNDSVGKLSPNLGGTYTGSVYVPGFTGCGVGEDLTPLVDATSAGTNNYLKVESGFWCIASPDVPEGCTDEEEPTTYTVLPGRTVEATVSPFMLTASGGNSIRCDSASLKINFKRGHYLSIYRIATVNGAQFKKCVRANGGVPVTVHGAGFPWSLHMSSGQGSPGQWAMAMNGFKLEVASSDGCDFSLNGLSYDHSADIPAMLNSVTLDADKNRLAIGPGNGIAVGVNAQCSDPDPDLQPTAAWDFGDNNFSYSPHQKITSP
ncbi:DUF6801 domain-containing protein [Spirillospora sp. NPDC052269]